MILALWLTLTPTFALDINDHLVLELAGGERVDGWFLRAEERQVVMSIPAVGETAKVPVSIIEKVSVNDEALSLSDFRRDLGAAWDAQRAWMDNPPPHPAPGIVAASGLLVAGGGHALLGDWDLATPMLIGDSIFMGVMGIEAAGKGTGRLDVFLSAAFLSVLFKSYALSDGHRRAQRRRERMGMIRPRNEKSPS